jgi:hypothetical protein
LQIEAIDRMENSYDRAIPLVGTDTLFASSFAASAYTSALPADTRRESVSHHLSAPLALAPPHDDPRGLAEE